MPDSSEIVTNVRNADMQHLTINDRALLMAAGDQFVSAVIHIATARMSEEQSDEDYSAALAELSSLVLQNCATIISETIGVLVDDVSADIELDDGTASLSWKSPG